MPKQSPVKWTVEERVRSIVANNAIEGFVMTPDEIEQVRQHVAAQFAAQAKDAQGIDADRRPSN